MDKEMKFTIEWEYTTYKTQFEDYMNTLKEETRPEQIAYIGARATECREVFKTLERIVASAKCKFVYTGDEFGMYRIERR